MGDHRLIYVCIKRFIVERRTITLAVHFSDEEKEKLKQDKASIYEDHTDEAIKEEIKNLSWKGKLKQFQHYYLKGVIIAVVIIAMIGLQVYDAVTKADVLLFICVQGDVIDDDNVEKIQKTLNEYLGYQDGKETVRLSLDGDDQQIQTFLYSCLLYTSPSPRDTR